VKRSKTHKETGSSDNNFDSFSKVMLCTTGEPSFLKHFNTDPHYLRTLQIEDKRLYAFVLKIKAKFQSSRVNEYSIKRVAELTGVARKTAKKYLNNLFAQDLCFIDNNTLVMRSLKHSSFYARRKDYQIHVSPEHSINDIVYLLDLQIIKLKISQQQFARDAKRNEYMSRHNSGFTLKEYKKHLKVKRDYPNLTHGALVEQNVIGTRKLAEELNCSQSRVCKLLHSLEQMGEISLSEDKRVIMRGVPQGFDMAEFKKQTGKKAGYLYQIGGLVVLHMGMAITVLT
jgi:DNA-binding MarR family transcriptional regulator